jgi:hypothetical protein
MEYYNNILCIEANKLWQSGVVSFDYYQKLKSRGKINVVRRSCFNTPALLAYQSIPDNLRVQLEAKCEDLQKPVTLNHLQERIEDDPKATIFFQDHKLPDGRHLKEKIQLEYYTNAILLNACHKLTNDRRTFRGARGKSTPSLWAELSRHIEDLTTSTYPHTLPTHPRRLEDRYKKYIADGYISLIHKNFCNTSALKVNDQTKEALLTELISDPRNLDNEQIRALYNIIAERMEWKKITGSAVAVWRDKLSMVSHAGRRGATDFMNNKAMQVKRSRPTCPLYYVTLDGWDVELLFQDRKEGTTTYHNRLTVVIVLDPCCNYPIGYAIGSHETPELITEALRNAANHSAELFGQRYRAHQLQSDHYSIKKLTPLYEALSDKVTPAKVKNAKAKVIEPYFRYLNKTYCQLMPNWSGFGVTSKKENQPNVDFLNRYRHNFPDQEGCARQIEGIINLERSKKSEQYLQLWEGTPQEDKLSLSWSNYLMQFGAETGYRNMLQGTGLQMSIEGIKHSYDCYDPKFREYEAVRWAVKYDPADTSKVLAINEDGTLRFELEEKYVQPMALKERKPGDYQQLDRVRGFNAALVENITEKRAASALMVGQLFENNKALEGTTTKLLLVDSKGQHKDVRNRARLAAARTPSTKMIECRPVVDDQDDEEVNWISIT